VPLFVTPFSLTTSLTMQYATHTHVDRHLAASVLPDAARRTTTHAADCRARTGGLGSQTAGTDPTEMFRGAEYFLLGGGDIW